MRNKKVVRIIITIMMCYIVFQIILYTFIHKRRKEVSDSSDQGAHQERTSPYKNIKDFVIESHNHGIPMILVDPVVLHRVVNMMPSTTSRCYFFCQTTNVTVFAVLNQLWTHDRRFLDALHRRDFAIQYVTEFDTSVLEYLSADGHTSVYTHYLIERLSHVIHLVILYNRPAGYLWHGRLHSDKNIYGSNNTIVTDIYTNLNDSFVEEGAYNIIDLIKVTMDGIKLRAPKYPNDFLDQISQSRFLRCNQSRARLFHSLYGQPHDDSRTFREEAMETLHLAKKTLDYLGIRFWLSSGTCLGWFRQCDIISYSGDVDIGIWIKDYDRRLIPAMQDAGFMLRHLFGKESDSFELSFYNGDMKLDIFFFYEEKDHVWNGGTQAKTGNKYKYIFPKFSLCWTEFLGLKIRVPCNTEDYIKANYGSEWFKPVKTWNWKSSPPNVRGNGQWPRDEWDKVILTFS